MAKLPSLNHFGMKDYDHIYEPSDDTYLLCDAIEQDRSLLRSLRPFVTMEIGSGTGCVIAFLGQLLSKENGRNTFVSLATDINPYATKATKSTGYHSDLFVDTVLTDLSCALEHRLEGLVDVMVFNPPYVPTPREEIAKSVLPGNRLYIAGCGDRESSNIDPTPMFPNVELAATWAGGKNGREIIDRFIPSIQKLLSPTGLLYMVLVKENDPADIANKIKDLNECLTCEIVISRRAYNEELCILRVSRKAT